MYRVIIEDIERAKQWAWKVAYATITAQGALLALFNNTNIRNNIDPSCGLLVFTGLSIGLAGFGLRHIRYSNDRLEVFRQRCDTVSVLSNNRYRFVDVFRDTLAIRNTYPTLSG